MTILTFIHWSVYQLAAPSLLKCTCHRPPRPLPLTSTATKDKATSFFWSHWLADRMKNFLFTVSYYQSLTITVLNMLVDSKHIFSWHDFYSLATSWVEDFSKSFPLCTLLNLLTCPSYHCISVPLLSRIPTSRALHNRLHLCRNALESHPPPPSVLLKWGGVVTLILLCVLSIIIINCFVNYHWVIGCPPRHRLNTFDLSS